MKPAAPPLQPFHVPRPPVGGDRRDKTRAISFALPRGDISMKAVVFHGVGDIRLDDVPEPKIEQPTDAIVRLTASAICGTDLHMVRGTMPGMVPGTILGHEGVGVVEEVGADGPRHQGRRPRGHPVHHLLRALLVLQRRLPRRSATTPTRTASRPAPPSSAGRRPTGPINGLQAEFARVPLADPTLIKLPAEMTDDQAILLSDIFPTGYFGADVAEIKPGDTVAVFGCGPVGLFAIVSARLLGAGRVFAVDTLPDRLAKARELGAETIDFNAESPVERLKELTGGVGVLRAIDAVGVDAYRPEERPGLRRVAGDEVAVQGGAEGDRSWRARGRPGAASGCRATPRRRC